MKIALASIEVVPFSKTGGLGDVCGALPKVLARMGHDVVVITPYHRVVERWFDANGGPPEVFARERIEWSGWVADVRFARSTLPGSDVPVIFVVNDAFDAPGIYTDDDFHRFTMFSRAAIRACEILDEPLDILHAHDWHTAMMPGWLESGLRNVPVFRHTGSVFTIHNLRYQGRFHGTRYDALGLPGNFWPGFEFFGDLNLMKGGIVFASHVTTVSPGYAREIRTASGGEGLDPLLNHLADKLTGILNGIDTEEWNPETDPALPANYGRAAMDGKRTCATALRSELGLADAPDRPLLGVVSRLVDQKGLDLLIPIAGQLAANGAQFALLGSGDGQLEDAFRRLAASRPDAIAYSSGFSPDLARRIIAGSDMTLMPSRFEPCGLNQMYGLRYGTLPLVRFTGGLADSVIPYTGNNPELANGFAFDAAHPRALFEATIAAMRVFEDEKTWATLQQNAMAADFSWEVAAKKYVEVFSRVAKR